MPGPEPIQTDRSPQPSGSDASTQGRQELARDAFRVDDRQKDTQAAPVSEVSSEKLKLLNAWQGISEQIVSYNARQGGGRLQNGVYELTRQTVNSLGLERAGWQVLPVQTGSALDMIGGDILLVNRRTGRFELLDASSRRLDPSTGEFLSSAESQKTNVPAIREKGVIDALPHWFDVGGRLEVEQSTPEHSQRVKEFAQDFRLRIQELTAANSDSPFNLKDFPLPSPTVTKDAEARSRELQAVVEWSKKNADESFRSGDRRMASDYKEFGRSIEGGALAFSARVNSSGLNDAVNKMVERIILEDAAKALYPQPKNAQGVQQVDNISHRQTGKNGTVVQVKPDGALVVTFARLAGPGGNGGPEIYSVPNVLGHFEKASQKLALSLNKPDSYGELARELPGHYRKMYEQGQLDMGKVLTIVSRFRNQFAAAGVGTERALLGHLVHRLAEREPDQIRKLANPEVAAKEGGEKAPRLSDFGREHGGDQGRYADRLSPQELQRLSQLTTDLERKGNLSPQEKMTLESLKRASEELSRPGGGGPQNNRLVAVRRVLSGEALNRAAGPAMIAAVVLNLYRYSNPGFEDEVQPSFGRGW
ncbi:MAG: hypothetical protein K2Y32_14335 [Candidatus Obscuribacterales bacterium]|nr:hypothetical protein [Candidatus Obscuribacterales bacterium]